MTRLPKPGKFRGTAVSYGGGYREAGKGADPPALTKSCFYAIIKHGQKKFVQAF
jgi:hypothetical protein